MKTPRDILFARHQTVVPKLDTVRREAVAGLNRQDVKTPSFVSVLASWCLGGSKQLWLELVWPCRRIWTGLAAIWILLFIVNCSQHDKSEMLARKTPPPSPEMMLAFRQQEMMLAELIGQNEPQVAERPKTFSPRPSSERRFETLTA